MGDIVNLEAYKQSKEEEKKRIKNVLNISNRVSVLDGIIESINEGIGVSILTKHFDVLSGVVGRELQLDNDLLDVIYNSLNTYKEKLVAELNMLNSI